MAMALNVQRCWMWGVVVIVLVTAWAAPVRAQEPPPADGQPKPALVDEDYASPRATLQTFLEQMERLDQGLEGETGWGKVYKAMETTGAVGPAREDAAWMLVAVYNEGLGGPKSEAVAPDQVPPDLTRFELFPNNTFEQAKELFEPILKEAGRDPPVKIEMVKTEDGTWKFAESTLDGINQLVAWARPLGVSPGSGVLRHVRSEAVRQWIPAGLQNRFFMGVELWQWVGLAIVIFLALAVDLIARLVLGRVLPRLTSRYLHVTDAETVRTTVRPIGVAIGAAAFLLLLSLLGLGGMPQAILYTAGRVVLVVGLTWAAWMMADLLSELFAARAARTDSPIDDMVVLLLRKTAKLFVIAMGVMYIAAAFNVELLPMLASFGIAGLAISFAAQDIVKNLFGGLAIFLDQPFKVGDRVVYKGYDGTIEDVGFRVTQLRTGDGHLVTIPNGGITNDPVENIARRPYIRRTLDLGVVYDTPAPLVEQAVRIVRGIVAEPGIREPIHHAVGGTDMPPRVHFSDLKADNYNIRVMYWYTPASWWDYMDHAQRLHLRIVEEFGKAGIELAFPTQTIYLARDGKRELAVRVLGTTPSDGERT